MPSFRLPSLSRYWFLKRALSALLLSAICQSSPVNAADSGWKQTGWGGGGFFYSAIHHPTRDGVIYLGGDVGGVYKTEDHGRHWRTINQGIAGYGVFSLTVDVRHPQTVYAATDGGLCKSLDGGEHWQVLPKTEKKGLRITGEKTKSVRSIAVDPSNSNVVYAASPAGKVYKSLDGGQTWIVSYQRGIAETDVDALRIQYGKVNADYFGGLWLPVTFPVDAQSADCIGLGFSFKGEGTLPQDSFLMLRTGSGVTYRSKNLRDLYQDTRWKDIVLTAEDFVVDPDYAKKNPGVAPATPEWSKVMRVDLGCAGPLPTESTLSLLGRFFFAFKAPSAGTPRLVTIKDFRDDKTIQSYGNIKTGTLSSAAGTIYSVSISPKSPKIVIAATEDTGLVMSTDAGITWAELTTPKKAACATFDPSNSSVIYGAFFNGGILKSIDAGKTWCPLSEGLAKGASIREVAVSPANPLNIYAIGSIGWTGAFYFSNDGGKSWKNSSTLTVDREGNPTLDGVNAGTASLSAPTNISINPRNPKELFMSANWRSCLSSDGGLTWKEADRGADISCVTDIRFLNGKTYVTAMDEGTFTSDDQGRNWRQLWPLKHTNDLSGHNWRVAVTTVNGADRIISTVSPWSETPNRIIRSDDGGKSFQIVRSGLPDYIIHSNTLWDRGYARALAVDPNDPKTVYLGIDGDPSQNKSGGGIFKSQDGGLTWAQLPHQPDCRRMYYGLTVDPTDSKRLFWGALGPNGGLYRSEDRGESWQRVFSHETWIWNVVTTADGTVYCSGSQLWRSTDHGVTWKQLTHFTEKWRAMVGLEVHPRDPNTLWISTTTWDNSANGGIYKTSDGGTSWTEITGDIPYVRPQVLRFNPDTNELWAGYVGLYKLRQ